MAWEANSDSPVTENSLYASVPKMLICIARLYCFLSPLPLVLLYNSASLLFFSWTKSLAFWKLVSLNSLSLNTIYFPSGVSPSGTLTFGTLLSSLLLPVADTQPSSECSDRHFFFCLTSDISLADIYNFVKISVAASSLHFIPADSINVKHARMFPSVLLMHLSVC